MTFLSAFRPASYPILQSLPQQPLAVLWILLSWLKIPSTQATRLLWTEQSVSKWMASKCRLLPLKQELSTLRPMQYPQLITSGTWWTRTQCRTCWWLRLEVWLGSKYPQLFSRPTGTRPMFSHSPRATHSSKTGKSWWSSPQKFLSSTQLWLRTRLRSSRTLSPQRLLSSAVRMLLIAVTSLLSVAIKQAVYHQDLLSRSQSLTSSTQCPCSPLQVSKFTRWQAKTVWLMGSSQIWTFKCRQ